MKIEFDRQEMARRFIRYASICTQSEEGAADTPSTDHQRELAALLAGELEEMGAEDVFSDREKCYVYASVPAWPASADVPCLALIAHMDTSNAVSADQVHPRLIPDYDGGVIVLDGEKKIVSDPENFTDLKKQVGKMLVVTDGHSVLGGDDKAGVAEIMECAKYFLEHPKVPHAGIRIMFTPDEEVGNGPLNADLDRLGADFGYTLDGGDAGQLEYENFNAASAHVTVEGVSTHPGSGKDLMQNALLMLIKFNDLLPADQIPARTEGYEGFYHLTDMSGDCESAQAHYIIRDHDRGKFEERKRLMEEAADRINKHNGRSAVSLEIRDSYYNMEEKIRPHMHIIRTAEKAIRETGLEPIIDPIRGGTDGCVFSYRGLPCPNLGTGAYHFHSRYEYVCVEEMVQAAQIAVRIAAAYAGKGGKRE